MRKDEIMDYGVHVHTDTQTHPASSAFLKHLGTNHTWFPAPVGASQAWPHLPGGCLSYTPSSQFPTVANPNAFSFPDQPQTQRVRWLNGACEVVALETSSQMLWVQGTLHAWTHATPGLHRRRAQDLDSFLQSDLLITMAITATMVRKAAFSDFHKQMQKNNNNNNSQQHPLKEI